MRIQSSFFKKISTSLVAALTVSALLLVVGNSGTLPWFPPVVVFSLVAISLLLAVCFPVWWHYQERNGKINSATVYGFLYTLTRYSIAFNLASFGWKKVLGLQFVVPQEIADTPMNQVNGEWLTWYYFGFSHTFGLILASIQIIGSFLLLFRKTFLAAAFVLLAFMANLTLINVFYGLNAGALVQSLITTIGIVFLILSEYGRLIQFFFKEMPQIPALSFANSTLKNLVRFSAILLSLLFTLYLKQLTL